MTQFSTIHRLATRGLLASTLLLAPSAAFALPNPPQQNNLEPRSAENKTAATPTWTRDQILTATVHQAWELSGKNEATFFEIVKQLAELSAANRGITLPESEAAGRRFGNSIKTIARTDTDQLLYAVVDKAVLLTAKTSAPASGQKH